MEGAVPVEQLKQELDLTEKGFIKSSRMNCTKIFRHDPVLFEKIKYNILSQRVDIIGDVHWDRKSKGDALANSDLRAIHLYIEETYGVTSEKYMDEAMYLVADENQYHPVRDYLKSLT